MSEKKYQIFVSSTYTDLIDTRKMVMDAILEMGHFPVGMEWFGTSDEEQWEIIERTLSTTDYYVLILGHRYGSLTKDGTIGYTEKEYDYAQKLGIPTLTFIRNIDASTTPSERETDTKKIKKLNLFREKAEQKTRVIWDDAKDLCSKLAISLPKQIRNKPQIGWVRGDQVISPEMSNELARLSKENSELRFELEEYKKNKIERLPKLEVKINDEETINIKFEEFSFDYPEKINIDETIKQYGTRINKEDLIDYNNIVTNSEIIEKYVKALELYTRVEKYSLVTRFSITNNGNLKTQDSRIECIFPDDILILNRGEKEKYKEPDSPIPSDPRITKKDYEYKNMNHNFNSFNFSNLGLIENIWKEGNKISMRVENLIHGYSKSFNETFYIVPLRRGKFDIIVEIISEEIPEQQTSTITINVE